MGRRIGYARVSTTDKQTTRSQLDALKAAGADPVFQDRASGAKSDRPGLRQALDALGPGDTLVVWRLDRLGRSLSHLIAVSNEIAGKGAFFFSINDGIDTGTTTGRMIYNIMGALAEFERELISERVNAGLASAKLAGKRLGRPARLTAKDAATIRTLLQSGETWEGVARTFRTSKTTIVRTLKRFPQEGSAPGIEGEEEGAPEGV
jgi:DNA invertase Pin-like site-specific DNA recombinase